ncbi:MAG: ATP-dependent Clp protease ATP-binding subunit ClpC, partial [Phycisphaerales bacterium]
DIEIEMKVKEVLKAAFRPEFLNRIDETIIFHQLTRDDLAQIAEIQVQYLRKRLADRDITLTLTESAKEKLSKDGFDAVYGARPLKRLIQHEIENPLAKRIVTGQFVTGDHITVNVSGEAFSFEKTPGPVGARA